VPSPKISTNARRRVYSAPPASQPSEVVAETVPVTRAKRGLCSEMAPSDRRSRPRAGLAFDSQREEHHDQVRQRFSA
jgi:hypothetical protein